MPQDVTQEPAFGARCPSPSCHYEASIRFAGPFCSAARRVHPGFRAPFSSNLRIHQGLASRRHVNGMCVSNVCGDRISLKRWEKHGAQSQPAPFPPITAPRGIQQGKSPRNPQRPINNAGTSTGQSTAPSTEFRVISIRQFSSLGRSVFAIGCLFFTALSPGGPPLVVTGYSPAKWPTPLFPVPVCPGFWFPVAFPKFSAR